MCATLPQDDDDILISPLLTGEIGTFDTHLIVSFMQRAIACAFLRDIQHLQWRGFLKKMSRSCDTSGLQNQCARYFGKATATLLVLVSSFPGGWFDGALSPARWGGVEETLRAVRC